MLDPDEVAAYEVWKHDKLVSETDLSIHAYNLEIQATALAWEAGARAAVSPQSNIERILISNPYRGKGAAGERKITS